MGKPLINFNIPKGEKFTGAKWLTFAVMAGATVAVWNYAERLPGALGETVGKVKMFVRQVVGSSPWPRS